MPIARSNVLRLPPNAPQCKFSSDIQYQGTNGIGGVIVTIHDKEYTAAAVQDIWGDVVEQNGPNDYITYLFRAECGGKALSYVGKTTRTLHHRYSGGPTGGLGRVFDFYAGGLDSGGGPIMECTLYNTSNPTLFEGWCFQIMTSTQDRRKFFNPINIMDPC